MWRKGKLYTLLVRMYIGTATMENRMEVTQKTENSTTIWSSNSTPGYTSEKKKQKHWLKKVHAAQCPWQHYLQLPWKQPVSINRWTDKGNVVYVCNGILPSHKKEWNFVICSTMDRLGGYYAKKRKSKKERHILYDITYIWNLKSKIKQRI